MPELPHVEVFRRVAEEHALHRKVETVTLRSVDILEGTSEGAIRDALEGHRLVEAHRHGKHLFLRSGEERRRWLRLHFGMTGALEPIEKGASEPEYTRLRLDFRGGSGIALTCPRKFAEIGLVGDVDDFVASRGLGPDVHRDDFGLRDLRERLGWSSGMVKTTLMDQEVLAGVGNVYADEALFQAGLHPETDLGTLDADDLAELWRALDYVLEKAIGYDADPERMPSTWLTPNRDDGTPCPRCDGTIRSSEVGGRATYHCDRHQTGR